MAKRFYFHLFKADQRLDDRTGFELSDETAVWRETLKIIHERWPGTMDLGQWRGWSVKVVDGCGRIVRIIALDDLA